MSKKRPLSVTFHEFTGGQYVPEDCTVSAILDGILFRKGRVLESTGRYIEIDCRQGIFRVRPGDLYATDDDII